MKRAEAIEWLEVMKEDAIFEQYDALKMAIEALSKPNYESDNEVRLVVMDRNKDKVVLWDAFGEVEYYPNGEINCVYCPRYYETEDDIGVHGHCKSHGRLIDADALIEDFNKLNEWLDIDEKAEIVALINNAPTVSAEAISEDTQTKTELANIKTRIENVEKSFKVLQMMFSSAEAIQGEWICKGDYAVCSKCGGSSGTQYDGVERIPRITTFCPHCGVKMYKGGEE